MLWLFFASGFVALLYQVIWQRLLGLVTGLDLYAVTLIVAVFMAGMGGGSYAGGVLADRLSGRALLGVFAAAEAVIAAFALVSKSLYHDLLYGLAATSTLPAPALALWSVSVIPRPAVFWGQFHGVPPERVIYAEDGTGLAVLTSPDLFFRRRADVFVNGLGQSTIPFGGVHTYLWLVPALLHSAPKRIAVIGLGSGDTAYAASLRRETEEVYCVEIIGGQIRTLRELHQ